MLLPVLASMMSVQATQVSVVPRPDSLILKQGHFEINAQTVMVARGEAAAPARVWRQQVEPAFGFRIQDGNSRTNVIEVVVSDDTPSRNPESYTLSATSERIRITAPSPRGAFYGLQTLRQLLPVAVFANAPQAGPWRVPAVEIQDQPRFRWRGSMLDVCRHMMPKEFVKKYIDLLAMHKMNTFHWHLTDDQGWRIEIKKYPLLTRIGAWRANVDEQDNSRPHRYRYHAMFRSPEVYGGYYTQEEVKEIVAYAAARYVTVVPEIEMPGHATAAIASYPELGNNPDRTVPVATRWGVFRTVFSPEESTIQFLKDVLDEVMALFPSEFIHIGGDECPKEEWKASERAQQLMRERGLADEHELQSWFIRQIDAYLTSKGRRLVGWSEILEGGLAENATVMSWLGTSGAIEAARRGNDAVMAPTSHTYLDYYQSMDRSREPQAIGGWVPLWKVYEFEPVPNELTEAESRHILGVQGQLWTEYMQHPKQVEYMAFPRVCAISEIGWTRPDMKDYADFWNRLEHHLDRLARQDVNFRRLDSSQRAPLVRWSSGEFGPALQQKVSDIRAAITTTGEYEVRFIFQNGAHRLDIQSVELRDGNTVVYRSDEAKQAGAQNNPAVYRFRLTDLPQELKLVFTARADGGTDSNGVIVIERIGN